MVFYTNFRNSNLFRDICDFYFFFVNFIIIVFILNRSLVLLPHLVLTATRLNIYRVFKKQKLWN